MPADEHRRTTVLHGLVWPSGCFEYQQVAVGWIAGLKWKASAGALFGHKDM